MIPMLILVAGVVVAASLRGRAVQNTFTQIGDYTPNSTQLQAQAAADKGVRWTGTFDLIGPVIVTTEEEFLAVGAQFEGLGNQMTQNDNKLLLELMFWATAAPRKWGS